MKVTVSLSNMIEQRRFENSQDLLHEYVMDDRALRMHIKAECGRFLLQKISKMKNNKYGKVSIKAGIRA